MILFRHILRAHFAPFIGSFFVLMFLFVLQFMMKFMDQLAGKGLSGAVIVELMVLNLAWIVVLAVPMAGTCRNTHGLRRTFGEQRNYRDES